ncbi:MAG: peptidylprolyl isomerase [Anaerolineae bacterium]
MRSTKLLTLAPPAMVILLLLVTACTSAVPALDPTSPTATLAPVEDTVVDTPVPEATATATMEPVAAIVNGAVISLEDYERQVASYEASMVAMGQDPDTPQGEDALKEGRQWVLNVMIEQVLIEQAAAAQGITVDDAEIDATIESLRTERGEDAFDQWLADEGMSLEDMRKRLRSEMIATRMVNQVVEAVPTHAEHVHARHILVSTEAEANRILSQLQAGGDFASLARAFSQDISTRDLGGDLGFFPRGILTSEEVEAAAFSLQPGQLSGVVESSLGYHIVQVVERVPDQEISPENLNALKNQALSEWLDELRAAADLQIFVTL